MAGNNPHSTGLDIESDVAGRSDAIDWSQAQEGIRLLLDAVGEDPERTPLKETWQRRVPAAFETLTEGTRDAEKPDMRTFPADTNDLIIKTGIPVYSLCCHHLLPYHGTAHVAYRPGEEVVGLSKLTRYIRWQSRRLTVQERLTQDIAAGLETELDADGVLVELQAVHLCEAMRGVETASTTRTRATVGDVDDAARQRFEDAIQQEES